MHLKQCDSKNHDKDNATAAIIPPTIAGRKLSVTPGVRRTSVNRFGEPAPTLPPKPGGSQRRTSWKASYSQGGVFLHSAAVAMRQRCWLVMWPLRSVDITGPLQITIQSATLQFAWLRMVHVIGNPNQIAHPMTQVRLVFPPLPPLPLQLSPPLPLRLPQLSLSMLATAQQPSRPTPCTPFQNRPVRRRWYMWTPCEP